MSFVEDDFMVTGVGIGGICVSNTVVLLDDAGYCPLASCLREGILPVSCSDIFIFVSES